MFKNRRNHSRGLALGSRALLAAGLVGLAAGTASAASPICEADITTQGAAVGEPGYGVFDGAVTAADLNFYVNAWVSGDLSVADVTTQGAAQGDPGFGEPDGSTTAADINYYVNAWSAGCPTSTVIDVDSGQTFSGAIDFLGDVDLFRIDADAGDSLIFAFNDDVASTTFAPRVTLVAPSGVTLASTWSTNGLVISEYDLTETGTYTYVIREFDDDSTGGYTFTAVVADDQLDANNVALTSGQSVTSALAIGDIDTFTIDADAGETLIFAINDDIVSTTFAPRVELYAPSGDYIAGTWSTDGLIITEYDLPETGTYTYVIHEFASDSVGGYTLTAVVPDDQVDADNVALTSGQTHTADLSVGDIDTYTIDADAGETLIIAFTDDVGSTTFAPRVELYAPSGAYVDGTWSTGGLVISEYNLTETGTYTYVVHEFAADSIGGYTLTAVVPDDQVDADNVALTSGQTHTADLSVGDIDTYTIDADAGETLIIAFNDDVGSTTFAPRVELYAPSGAYVDGTWSTGGLVISEYTLTETGTYTYVIHEFASDSIGGYTLTAVVPDDQIDAGNVSLTNGQVVAGTIDVGDIDTFTIDADLGDTLTISITDDVGSTVFAPRVELYAPSGAYVDGTWSTSGVLMSSPGLPESGRYTYVVHEFAADSTGGYTLSAAATP